MLHRIISRQRCKLVCRGPFVFKLFSCFHSLSTFIRTFSMMKGKNWRRRNLQYPNPSRSLWLLKRKMQNVIQHFSFALSILWTDKRMHLLMKFPSFKWDVDFVISSNIWFLYLVFINCRSWKLLSVNSFFHFRSRISLRGESTVCCCSSIFLFTTSICIVGIHLKYTQQYEQQHNSFGNNWTEVGASRFLQSRFRLKQYWHSSIRQLVNRNL